MNRRGVALLLAIAALAVLAIVTATAVLLAARESQIGRAALTDIRAKAAADAVLADLSRGFSRTLVPSAPGDTAPILTRSFSGATARVTIRALGGPIFGFEATGEAVSPGGIVLSTYRIEVLARLDSTAADSLLRPRQIPRGWRPIP